jgi:hypothetical protein
VTSLIIEMPLQRLIDGIACDIPLNLVTADDELIESRGLSRSTIGDAKWILQLPSRLLHVHTYVKLPGVKTQDIVA